MSRNKIEELTFVIDELKQKRDAADRSVAKLTNCLENGCTEPRVHGGPEAHRRRLRHRTDDAKNLRIRLEAEQRRLIRLQNKVNS